MSNEHDAASHIRDFLSGLKANPNMPNLKTVVGKLTSLPGVAQFKGVQIQMLRVQEELLKGQIMLIEQLIQALEATPEPPASAPEETTPETPTNGKIIVT
jgi:hypothetical protein